MKIYPLFVPCIYELKSTCQFIKSIRFQAILKCGFIFSNTILKYNLQMIKRVSTSIGMLCQILRFSIQRLVKYDVKLFISNDNCTSR